MRTLLGAALVVTAAALACNNPESPPLLDENLGDNGDGTGLPEGGNGGDAGTPSECEGLSPATPEQPVRFLAPLGAFETGDLSPLCSAGTSDGAGHLGLSLGRGQSGSREYIVSSSGALVGSFDGRAYSPYGQLSGFTGFQHGSGSSWLTALDHEGAVVKQTPERVGTGYDAENPLGGVVIFGHGANALVSFDAVGEVRWEREIPEPYAHAVIGVDREGWILLLRSATTAFPSAFEGRWIDPAGTVGEPFEALPSTDVVSLALIPRVGDGLFLQGNDGHGLRWLRAFRHGAAGAEPIPDWLVSRPNSTLRMARGGRAYAVMPIPGPGETDCVSQVEVLTAEGRSCGVARFRAAETACVLRPLGVGYDGTVVQTLPEGTNCDQTGLHCPCAWQFWPGFLR